MTPTVDMLTADIVPFNGQRAGVYFLIRDNVVIYVGSTWYFDGRLDTHRRTAMKNTKWQFDRVMVLEMPDWDFRHHQTVPEEVEWIKRLQPELNTIHTERDIRVRSPIILQDTKRKQASDDEPSISKIVLGRLLEQTGLTMSGLSRKSGITVPVLSQILSGKRKNMAFSTLQCLMKAVGFSWAWMDENCPKAVLPVLGPVRPRGRPRKEESK